MTWMTVWLTLVNTAFWLACCFGFAWGVRLIPKSIYEKSTWFFNERAYEKRFYKLIKIERWKDKLPEMGKLLNFEKKHLKKELDLDYVNKFIQETYYAEFGHLCMAIFGFACILVNPSDYALMALICSIVNFIVQIPFCLIQRYNRPRLLRLKRRLEYKEGRK